VHAKGLRANIRPWPILDALLDGALPDHRLRLDLDDGAMTIPGTADSVDRYRRAGVDVRVHRRFSDAELIGYLTEVDVAVLPYVFGTHSGWVEAFHDAGTTVLTPDCGFFTEQHGTLEYGYGPDGLDEASLLRAATTALQTLRDAPGEDLDRRDQRRRERDDVRNAMVALYATAAGVSSAA
jgi:hypothetical protein